MNKFTNKFKIGTAIIASAVMFFAAIAPAGALDVGAVPRVGQLVYNPGSRTVYLVGNNSLYGFPDAATFYSWGFKFSQISVENTAEQTLSQAGVVPTKLTGCAAPLDQINNNCGSTVSASPRVGQLVYTPGKKIVYLVGSGGLYGFPDAATFYSWGFRFSQILKANKAEAALSMIGTVPAKQAGCSDPLSQINGTCGSSLAPAISNLNPASGPIGTFVTITGSNFAATGNKINLGGHTAATADSANGTTLSFVFPNGFAYGCENVSAPYACDPIYQQFSVGDQPTVSVSNANGTSNILNFTVTAGQAGAPKILDLNPGSGPVGTQVTITGSGFTADNKVSFGNLSLGSQTSSVSSSNGQSIAYAIPSQIVPAGPNCQPPMYCVSPAPRTVVPGTYYISVTNANGASNTEVFTVTGATGTSINVVTPAGGEQWAVGSAQVVKWTAPSSVSTVSLTLSPYIACLYSNPRCMIAEVNPYPIASNVPNTGSFNWTISATATDGRTIAAGQYMLNIASGDGSLSGRSAAPFTLTNPAAAGAPVISGLSPSSGPVGIQVAIFGSGFTATGNSVSFKGYTIAANASSGDGKTLQFTVPSYLVPSCPAGTMCPQYVLSVTPGDYQVAVVNANGTSNSLTFTVTSGQAATPTITGLSPSSGPVGTQVAITGTGFTATGNNVQMGSYSAGTANSANGTTLTFTVPSGFSNCNLNIGACTNSYIFVNPADYLVSVSNTNGTSNPKTFTITKALCPEVMCAAPPTGYYYVPTPGACGCGTLTPNNQ